MTQWNLDFMDNSDEGKAYMDLASRVDEAIQFMNACGLAADHPIMNETEFYVSHECLLLDYEQALTREDSTTGLWYDCSGESWGQHRNTQPVWSAAAGQPSSGVCGPWAFNICSMHCLAAASPSLAAVTPHQHALLLHGFRVVQQAHPNMSASCCLLAVSICMAAAGHFLWCGERTRQLDGAHLEFMRGIGNPIGVKVSDKMEPSQLVEMIQVSLWQCWQGCFMCA